MRRSICCWVGILALVVVAHTAGEWADLQRGLPATRVGMTMSEVDGVMGKSGFGILGGGSAVMVYRKGSYWIGYRTTVVDYYRGWDSEGLPFRVSSSRVSADRPVWLDRILKPLGW